MPHDSQAQIDLARALDVLKDLALQVKAFCETQGEGDFELAEAEQVLHRHGLWLAPPQDLPEARETCSEGIGDYMLISPAVKELLDAAKKYGQDRVTMGVMAPGEGPMGLPRYIAVISESVENLIAGGNESARPDALLPAGWWIKRVGEEILVTGPAGGMHVKATGTGLGNRLLYSFADDLLTHQDTADMGTNPVTALSVPLVQRTAPEVIFLQISDNAADSASAFPSTHAKEVTWSADSAQACEVQYIRADLAKA